MGEFTKTFGKRREKCKAIFESLQSNGAFIICLRALMEGRAGKGLLSQCIGERKVGGMRHGWSVLSE